MCLIPYQVCPQSDPEPYGWPHLLSGVPEGETDARPRRVARLAARGGPGVCNPISATACGVCKLKCMSMAVRICVHPYSASV